MLDKILVPVLFLGAQFMIVWYADFTGKLASKGTYLGIAYDSAFARALVTQFEYLWVLIIINMFFSLAFHIGFSSYKDYLIIAGIWMASAPIATLIYNTIFLKEKIDAILIVGIILVTLGALAVIAHKDIAKMFNIG